LIKSAWKKAGCWPVNNQIVLKKIKEIDKPELPDLPLIKNSDLLSTALQTAEQAIKISKAWQQKLDNLLSSPSRKNFNKYIESQKSVIARVARGQQEGLQYSRDNSITQTTML
jgi:hypothetical protein